MALPKSKSDLPPSMRRTYRHLSEDQCRKWLKDGEALLQDWLKHPALKELLLNDAEGKLGQALGKELVIGAFAQFGYKQYGDGLNPFLVGRFLARLAACPKEDVAWEVRELLKGLGIKRLHGPGRPKGRESEREHFIQYKVWMKVIETKGLVERVEELKKNSPKSWRTRFRDALQSDGFSRDEVDLVLASKNARSLAIKLAAKVCGVSEDTMQRSVRHCEA